MADTLYGYVCVWCIYFTRLYMHGLMPCVFLLLHARVLVKLWVICIVAVQID